MTWGLIGLALFYILISVIKEKIRIFQAYPIIPKLVFLGFHVFFFIMGIIEGVFATIIFFLISIIMIILIEIVMEGERIAKLI